MTTLDTSTAPNGSAYIVFAGELNAASVQRIFNSVSMANAISSASHVHLLFQSPGGRVDDGVCLYNFFRSLLPFDLTIYNCGSVQSMGTLAFLGAKFRKVSAHATFMIHRSRQKMEFGNAAELESCVEACTLDDSRIESILRAHLRLPDTLWEAFKSRDLTFNAVTSVELGIADEVVEFLPPREAKIMTAM
jgi:ATP-dependent Clp protease, protease subunit